MRSLFTRYAERPNSMESVSLAEFATQYNYRVTKHQHKQKKTKTSSDGFLCESEDEDEDEDLIPETPVSPHKVPPPAPVYSKCSVSGS